MVFVSAVVLVVDAYPIVIVVVVACDLFVAVVEAEFAAIEVVVVSELLPFGECEQKNYQLALHCDG